MLEDPVISFKTELGSIYTYDSGGRVSRQKSALGSTMEASTSSFDRTVFVSPKDIYSARMGYEMRGLRPLEDGTLQGLDFNEDKLDKVKFLELRQKKVPFDEEYISSGGTITPRSITPELQPKMGYYPFEYNLGDNKFHAGSQVVEIHKRFPITTRVGPPPPESGTTLRNVGTEPAQPTLRGTGLTETVYSGALSHEEQMDKIQRMKDKKEAAAKTAQEKPKLEAEKKERKAARRAHRPKKKERKAAKRAHRQAREAAKQASKNAGGISVRRTRRC